MFRALNRILQGTIRTVEPLQGADLWEVHMGASEPAWSCVGKGEPRDTIDQPRAMAPTANSSSDPAQAKPLKRGSFAAEPQLS